MRPAGPALAAAVLPFALAGCLISSHSHVTRTGVEITESQLEELRPGDSTYDDVIAVLGTPTTSRCKDDGVETLLWENRVTNDRRSRVLFLFSGHTRETDVHSVEVVLRDGIVERVTRR